MSTTTENYNLIIPEGDDLFAPLNVEAPNFRSIDSNMWDNRLAGVQSATELISGSVHAITRETPDAPMFRYTATGGVNSGDTFTVDGIAVQAVLPNGMAIEAGAYIEGCEVLAAVVGSKMTLYIGAGSGDADTLEGHPASYFGTAQRTEEVAALAQAANVTADAARRIAEAAGINVVEVWTNPDPTSEGTADYYIDVTAVAAVAKFYIVAVTYNNNWSTGFYNTSNSIKYNIVFPGVTSEEVPAIIESRQRGTQTIPMHRQARFTDANTLLIWSRYSDYYDYTIPYKVYAVY